MIDWTGRVALVTGANRGLGFEIARQLGAMGITVLVGARDQAKGAAAVEALSAGGARAAWVHLDMANDSTLHAAPGAVQRIAGRLDILVNNAAIYLKEGDHLPSNTSIAVVRETLDTNVFGVHLLTQALLPLLVASDTPRIVNMSSAMGSISWIADAGKQFGGPGSPAYRLSKIALNGLTVLYAAELRDTPAKVNATSPGWVKTDMGGAAAPLTVERGADTPVWLATLPADGPTGGFFSARKPVPW